MVNETELIQEIARDWLIHSARCDDIARVMDTLLLLLLQADTSRVSVQHLGGEWMVPQYDCYFSLSSMYCMTRGIEWTLRVYLMNWGLAHKSI